ncbi:hypothetical protein [Halobacillus yeomjeoni]|uniref:Uncharacterized protein n=1 Tax=Halobacillus yeomjeoni TaxID=311194 RepID=A0A931HXX9_9BACI|nr:hypothetical protein [Halobacillus yeomjeoni]MBH0231469.1 hypothetical protein [Halobacillus yeomjeoni]
MNSKNKSRLSEEKLHYIIAATVLISWLLYFAAYQDLYDKKKIYQGIIFISILAPLYAGCVFAFFHFNKNNK